MNTITQSAVEFFASIVLDLYPVSSGEAKGFWGRYRNKKDEVRMFYVSHSQILHIYSSVNRFMRDKSYDTNVVKRDVEGTPYLRFHKTQDDYNFIRHVALSPGMETLFDVPLTGGKW